MSILNVDKIQPIGGGSTITVDATDIQASTGTIRASTFSGDVSATGIGVTSLNVTGVSTITGNAYFGSDIYLTDDSGGYEKVEVNVNDVRFEHKHLHSEFGVWARSTSVTDRKNGIEGSGNDLLLYSNTTEKVRIDSNGRVVIGHTQASTNYGKLLHIHNSASAGASLHLTDSTTGTSNSDGFEIVTHSQAAYLVQREPSHMIFMTSGTNERLRITSAGNIGINSTSPGALLDLSSSQPGILFSETGVSANNGKWLNQANASELYWQAQTDAHSGGGNLFKMTRSAQQIQSFEGQQSGATWFTIRNSDKTVGIGTDNPGAPLHIESHSAGLSIRRNGQYLLLDANSGNGGDQSISASNGFRIQTGGIGNSYERLRITSGGDLLIGRTSSSAHSNANELQIGSGSGTSGLTIFSSTSNAGSI